ncbi:MAG: hypothetical protein ACKPEQ_03235 [Dolichospermum sp.]
MKALRQTHIACALKYLSSSSTPEQKAARLCFFLAALLNND